MPTYKITDPKSGKHLKITGPTPPTKTELDKIFARVRQTSPVELEKPSMLEQAPKFAKRIPQAMGTVEDILKRGPVEPIKRASLAAASPEGQGALKSLAGKVSPYANTALPIGGALTGALLTSPGNIPAPGIASAVGAGLGYAGGKKLAHALGAYAGKEDVPTLKESLMETAKDVPIGAAMEFGGPIAGRAVGAVGKGIGAVAKPVLGRLTGAGTGAIEEAMQAGKALKGNVLKTQTPFDKALRKDTEPGKIVEKAKNALSTIKQKRAQDYAQRMEQIASGEGKKSIEISPIKNKIEELVKQFVPHDAKGKPLWSRMAIGKEGSTAVKDIKEIIGLIKGWGSKQGDRTVTGLDALKRQLDDFYSDSSKARAFVAALRGTVKDTITKNVPAYGEMTSEYAIATNLVTDLEKGLMLRKHGMEGKIVADQTLRRLVSAMRDNFPLRKELVDILGKQGGEDIAGEVAGHALSPILPRGISGAGPALAIEAFLTHLNPAFAGLITLSSPRLVGEFLRLFGRGLMEAGKIAPAATKAIGYGSVESILNKKNKNVEGGLSNDNK